MVNFLKAEKYRALRHPSTQATLLLSAVFVILLSLQARFAGYDAPTLYNYYDSIIGMMSFGVYAIAAVVTASFEKDRAMLQQLVAQGHTKTRIIIGQYVSSLCMSVFLILVLSLLSILMGGLLYPSELSHLTEYIGWVAELGFYSIALLIPLNAIAISLQYIFLKRAVSIPMFFVVALILPLLLEVTRTVNRAIDKIMLYTPYEQFFLFFSPSYDMSILVRTIVYNLVFWLGIALVRFGKLDL